MIHCVAASVQIPPQNFVGLHKHQVRGQSAGWRGHVCQSQGQIPPSQSDGLPAE